MLGGSAEPLALASPRGEDECPLAPLCLATHPSQLDPMIEQKPPSA
jgi:hypothetical protein